MIAHFLRLLPDEDLGDRRPALLQGKQKHFHESLTDAEQHDRIQIYLFRTEPGLEIRTFLLTWERERSERLGCVWEENN